MTDFYKNRGTGMYSEQVANFIKFQIGFVPDDAQAIDAPEVIPAGRLLACIDPNTKKPFVFDMGVWR